MSSYVKGLFRKENTYSSMKLTEHTLKHSVKVAELMSAMCPNFDKSLDPREMYVVGLVHDIGKLYEDGSDTSLLKSVGHAFRGGNVLEDMKFKYHKEVFYHGHPEYRYRSPVWYLLNFADLSVDRFGNVVEPAERLTDIKKRYGENSVQYQRALQIINELLDKGYL